MWEQYLRELIDGFKHPAWGLAQEKGVEVDKDALHFVLRQNTMSQRTQ